MRTRLNLLRAVCSIPLMLAGQWLHAQDTLDARPFERYWTNPRLVAKVGVGVQETAFIEAGVQWHKIYVHPLSLASAGPYLTIDGMIRDDDPIVGPRVGYEITAGLVGVAADVTCFTDFERTAWVFTPRAGLTIMGFVNLFYGRHLLLDHFLFSGIDRNRFSLVFNLNRDYFNVRNAPRRLKRKTD